MQINPTEQRVYRRFLSFSLKFPAFYFAKRKFSASSDSEQVEIVMH